MDIYSQVYDYLDLYYKEGEYMVGEHMLALHLKKNNIFSKVQYHDMNHPFYPTGKDSMTHSLIRRETIMKPNAANTFAGN